ncbi:HU family DNA-binding protein [Streptomyces libani]|uniref:HU family DNA-binding protein n=1 Tax=Streptomyces nigrescens TaxID=1920 RepID=A0ABY7J3S1_STRNI|nr:MULTISPECIES: HU family DNA-binding protein [Streptomyces]MCW7989740.1 DNA-binding protein [Streptomyces platensis subsp. clarensis]MCR8578928.1 HU family DNA-binding protein [Streptomyces sp. Isolate_219]MCX5448447.1 HU family DNA-binding protein [Streptomyces libani]WAU04386.1 HU family DNA-binding protein [Streptomyces nigrescens]WDT57775.1 HU family DNA-binding protein [Streptomyces sp. G7(2002)]
MNKAQLVEAIADKLGGRQNAADAVDAVLDAIVRSVVSGDRVSVTGFGSFEKVDRPARYARNPQTGERVRVKKTSVPRFRAGQGFKDLVSGSKKLPKGGEVSVKKAPKGSLTGGAAIKKAAAKKATAKKAAAKKTTAKKTAAKKTTAAKKATAKKTTAKKAPAKAAAKKATTAKKTTAKKATAKKTAPAKKTTAKKAPAKKATARKTTAKKTTARKR